MELETRKCKNSKCTCKFKVNIGSKQEFCSYWCTSDYVLKNKKDRRYDKMRRLILKKWGNPTERYLSHVI